MKKWKLLLLFTLAIYCANAQYTMLDISAGQACLTAQNSDTQGDADATNDSNVWTNVCSSSYNDGYAIYEVAGDATNSILVDITNISGAWSGIFALDADPLGASQNCLATFTNGSSSADMQLIVPPFNGTVYLVLSNFGTPNTATFDICAESVLAGCTDSTACNYNPDASIDSGNCDFGSASCPDPCNPVLGCTDPLAQNYNSMACEEDASCVYDFTCGGTLVDNGGSIANYANNSNDTLTICPINMGDVVRLEFTLFDTESCCDDLTIFDGADATAASLGTFAGTTSPGIVTADEANGGCLTLVFDSDGSVNGQGYEANISCIAASSLGCVDSTACNYDPVATIDDGSCDFGNSDCSDPCNPVSGCFDPAASNFNAAACVDDNSCQFDFTCGGTLVDNGGSLADYQNNTQDTITICPDVAGDLVQLVFTAFGTESCCDDLTLYDGADVTATSLGTFAGTTSPGTVLSSDSTGCLTLVFDSDGSVAGEGYVAEINCLSPAVCNLVDAGLTIGACNDGGTDNDASDDTYTFTLDPSGLNLSATYTVTGDVLETGTIGTPLTISAQAGAGDLTITIIDGENENCNLTVTVTDPGTCSPVPSCGNPAFFDTGGAANDYSSSENITYSICPDDPATEFVSVTFNSFSTENSGDNCFDQLEIYDGDDPATDPLIPPTNPATTETGWCWDLDDATPNGSGNLNGVTLESTDDSGCLTFIFVSDGSVTKDGWDALVSCVTIVNGCTDSTALNYNPAANTDDGSCEYEVCTLLDAGITVGGCDDAGTTTVTNDDTFPITLNPTGTGIAAAYTISGGLSGTGTYGTPIDFAGVAGAGDLTIVITDNIDPTCTITVVATDPGSCSPLICTDSTSYIELCWNPGGFTSEVTFDLVDDLGNAIADIDGNTITGGPGSEATCSIIEVVNGTSYTINGQDSFGDGWNGGTVDVNIYEDCFQNELNGCPIISGFTLPSGSSGSTSFAVEGGNTVISGCTDPNACNYNDCATVDDGSCALPQQNETIDVATVLTLDCQTDCVSGDSRCSPDGEVWYVFTTPADSAAITIELLGVGQFDASNQIGVAVVSAADSTTVLENSTIGFPTSAPFFPAPIVTSSLEPNTTYFIRVQTNDTQGTFQLCTSYELFCTQDCTLGIYEEFDLNSCSCVSANVEGCTDPLADNYNVLATCDDGSCEFLICNLLDAGLSIGTCNDNGTNNDTTDDFYVVTLNPTGNALGTSYTVSGDLTGSGVYGTPLNLNASAGAGDLLITITDDSDAACILDSVLVADPGSCSPVPSCGSDWFDNGGQAGAYNPNSDELYVICPDNPGEIVSVTFTFVDVETRSSSPGCWDFLTVYDGPDTTSTSLGTWCGEESGDGGVAGPDANNLAIGTVFTSTDASGCITFTFDSDGSVQGAGWEAIVECSTNCPDTLLLNNSPEAAGIYEADDAIESTSVVGAGSGGSVTYNAGANAGEYILLDIGFEADGSVDFEAENIDCDPSDNMQ